MITPPPEQHNIAKAERMARLCLIADTLYWKVSEDGLTFSYEGDSPSDNNVQWQKSHTAYKAGFRIGLGYRIPHDKWEISAALTQIRNYTQWKTTAKEGSSIHPSFSLATPLLYDYGKMSESWHLKYKLLDLEISHRTPIGKAFGIHPFFGLRGARIEQLIHLQFVDPQDSSPPLKVEGKNNYHAYIGPRLGVELEWHLARYVALFGRASTSFLFGHFDVDMKIDVDTFPEYTLFSNAKHPSGFAPNLELSSGLKGTIPLYRKRAFLTLGIAYEFSEWFFQNALPTVFTDSGFLPWSGAGKRGNLFLQGVTLLTRLDF